MKMHKEIGGACASFRSIFTVALLGALVAFAGTVSGGADEKSGYCKWPADWDSVASGDQGFDDLDAVDPATDTIQFNGATSGGTRNNFTFPAPMCDWDDDGDIDAEDADDKTDDFFNAKMECAATVATGGNLFGSSATAVVNWAEDNSTDGEIDLTGQTIDAPTAGQSCTLSLDWVGSNTLDGPITWTFEVAIVPDPFAAPAAVHAVVESYNSMYVEWTQVEGSDADADPDTYFIEWTTGTTVRSTTVDAAAIATRGEAQRQGTRITGLTAAKSYSVTVAAQKGSGATKNYGRTSAKAVFGIDTANENIVAGLIPMPTDSKTPYKLSVGETVEIDPQDFFMDLAINGRDIDGVANDIEDYDNYIRGTRAAPVNATFELTTNDYVDTLYISTDPATMADDLVRLHGLKNGTKTLTLTATIGMETVVSNMVVKVLENSAPRFTVSEATVHWQIDKDAPTASPTTSFTIDVKAEFVKGSSVTDDDVGNASDCADDDASNAFNCDEELIYKISKIADTTGHNPLSYFEITEDNEKAGLITVKSTETSSAAASFTSAVQRLDEGDEIGMTVTVTDVNGGQDTMNIYVQVSFDGNFGPLLASTRTSTEDWLKPITTAAVLAGTSGSSRSFDFNRKFKDPEGDHLCYTIKSKSLTGFGGKTLAEADLGRQAGQASTCLGSELTIEMILPSTDPENANGFALLGVYGVATVSVVVEAYDLGSREKSPAVTVKVRLAYGANTGPNVRAVAKITSGTTFLASGAHEIDEGADIRLTFTADDAQPTGDILCWSANPSTSFRCRPCNGDEGKSATSGPSFFTTYDSLNNTTESSRKIGTVSHEYDLVIKGTKRSGSRTTTVTDYEKYNGVYSFNVCATDLSGATHSIPFDVKLTDKLEAPVFSKPTSRSKIALYMLVGDYSQDVTVRATDGDGDDITYGAAFVGSCPAAKLSTDSTTGVITVTPTTSNLSTDDGKMTCSVEVSAADEEHAVYTNQSLFTVTVKNDNSAPKFADGWSSIAYDHGEYVAGKPYGTAEKTVGGKIRVTDDDIGDVVSVEISPSGNFSARSAAVKNDDGDIVGYDITISVSKTSAMDFEAAENSFDLTLVAMDEYGGSSDIDVRVDLTDRNERPTLVKDDDGKTVGIDDQKILVGVEKCIANTDEVFEDPDARDKQAGLFIEASTTRPGDAAVSVKDNKHICIKGINPGSGKGRVKVTATDRDGEVVSTTFRVEVEKNEAPTVVGDGIPDQEVQENGRTADIDLTAYFDDGDMAYEETLSFSFEVERASIATGVLIDGHFLRIYGDSKGETEVTVTATDQNDQSVSHTFKVEVIRNDPPVANADAFDDVEQYMGRDYDPIDAREAFTDEGDELTYYVSTKNTDVATAAIKYDDEGGAWVVLNLHSPGTTSVTVTVYDTANNSATNSFDLTVLARNDPPMLANAIEDVEVEEGASHDVSMDGVFEDEGSLDYEVKNEDENIADVFYRASNNSIRIYGNKSGTTTVVVVATDNIGQTASDEFEVTVTEPEPVATNSAPVLSGTLDDQTVTAGEPISVSIEGVFTDPDGDELTYTAESDDTNVATVGLENLDLTITGVNAGSTIFKITASDSEFNVVGEFDVEVETIPEAVGTIPDQTLQIGGEGSSLSVGEFFFDQDGDVLTYTIESSGTAATVTNVAADISMSPYTRGSTSVTVTASDPKGRSATQTFSIAVGDDELRNVAGHALAGIARSNISSTSAALGSRLESSRSDTSMGFSFGSIGRYLPFAGDDVVDNSAAQARQQLMGFNTAQDSLQSSWNDSVGQEVDFNFNLPSFDSMIANRFSRTLNGNGGIGSWSVWGTADSQEFEGAGYDGNSNSLFLGLDVQSNECWLFGVTVSRNTAESDYSWGTASQTLETTLTTILPYLSYEPIDGKGSAWAVLGRGSGDADTTVVNASAESSDLSFNLAMFGGRREFAKAGSLQLAFRGDVAVANLETADGNGAIDALAASVNRVRAGVEGSFSVDTGNGGKVTPFGELAFRNDGGDGLTGNGVEIAGGVRIDTNSLTLEARGRMLATHSADDFSETGVSLMVNFHPSSDETGLSFTLSPQWGASSQDGGFMWAEAASYTVSPIAHEFGAHTGLSLNSKLSYGFALNHGKYLLAPYVDVQDTATSGKTIMIGSELKQLIAGSRTVNMRMFVGATEARVDQITPKLGIQAQLKF